MSAEPTSGAAARVRYETPADGVARIVLSRSDRRNAQDLAMLYAINEAFDRAARDDDVRVILLAADGPHFCSGHDRVAGVEPVAEPISNWGGFDLPGVEGFWAWEQETYLGLCWRWRNLPKPTIAEVQGYAVAAGLQLIWTCDLIVAADNAVFGDPTVSFGVNGIEYFAHPWELGPRKAKEFLFTGATFPAKEALRLGMVNHVVPVAELAEFSLDLASRIALQPTLGVKLAKQSVNQMLEAQGQWTALQAAMSLQHLGHAQNQLMFGNIVDPGGDARVRALLRDEPMPARGSE